MRLAAIGCDWRCRDNCANKVGRRRRNVIRQLRIGSRRIDKQQRIAAGGAGKKARRQEGSSEANRLGKSHTQNKKARSADLQAVISLMLRSLSLSLCLCVCVCVCGQNCCWCCQYSAGLGQAAKINEALQKKARLRKPSEDTPSRREAGEPSRVEPSQVEPSRIELSQVGLPPSH